MADHLDTSKPSHPATWRPYCWSVSLLFFSSYISGLDSISKKAFIPFFLLGFLRTNRVLDTIRKRTTRTFNCRVTNSRWGHRKWAVLLSRRALMPAMLIKTSNIERCRPCSTSWKRNGNGLFGSSYRIAKADWLPPRVSRQLLGLVILFCFSPAYLFGFSSAFLLSSALI